MEEYIKDFDKPCAEKLSFDTKDAATAAAIHTYERHGTKVKPYNCPHCQSWHLSRKA